MSEMTPNGVPIRHCTVCGRRHPITRLHCRTCGIASAFVDPESGMCLNCRRADSQTPASS